LMSLYIISTPIGNMEDITDRAKKMLSQVDVILAEKTSKVDHLFSKLGIERPRITSYNEQNKYQKINQVINWLGENKDVGLVSEAGTPLVSDPGYELVRVVIKNNFEVKPVPGPSALIAALTVSGFPPTRFSFLGFLSKNKSKKKKIFRKLLVNKKLIPTIVFYESPQRVIKTLKLVKKVVGDVSVVVCRELTKKFEEKIRGNVSEVIGELERRKKVKGEITVVVRLD